MTLFHLRTLHLVAATAAIGFLAVTGTAFADDATNSKPAATADGDTVIVLASDTPIGPDMGDTDTAVRYYCSTRGKLSVFVSKERPPEMRDTVLRSWSVLTYRCVTPQSK